MIEKSLMKKLRSVCTFIAQRVERIDMTFTFLNLNYPKVP